MVGYKHLHYTQTASHKCTFQLTAYKLVRICDRLYSVYT